MGNIVGSYGSRPLGESGRIGTEQPATDFTDGTDSNRTANYESRPLGESGRNGGRRDVSSDYSLCASAALCGEFRSWIGTAKLRNAPKARKAARRFPEGQAPSCPDGGGEQGIRTKTLRNLYRTEQSSNARDAIDAKDAQTPEG